KLSDVLALHLLNCRIENRPASSLTSPPCSPIQSKPTIMIPILRPLSQLALMIAILGLAACSKPQAEGIQIGEIASLTGKEAAFGQASHKGTLLAIEELNAAGGVLGQ